MDHPATDRLLSVEEATERIAALVGRREPRAPEIVAIGDALGRVTAEEVRAAVSLPPWDNSAMDGYALRSSDVGDASDTQPARLRVIGEIAAGAAPATALSAGTAIRIATGAPLPSGADAVVEVESTTPVRPDGTLGEHGRTTGGPMPEAVLVHRRVDAGSHVRRAGSDLVAGDVIVEPGQHLGPARIALLAGAGIGSVRVHPRVRVGVLATGDEVRAAGAPLGPAGIPDANGPGLRALVTAAGAEAIDLGIATDVLDDVSSGLERALAAGCDAVVVAGGVSVGPYDVVRAAFERLGQVDLWRVAVQPGKPFALGLAGDVPLFGLPGNPVSGFVTFELFVRPAILALGGRARSARSRDRGLLLDAARTSPGRRAYLRVVAERDSAGSPSRDEHGRVRLRLARGIAGQGSHVLTALAAAEALAIVPEAVEEHRAGDPVDLIWLDAN